MIGAALPVTNVLGAAVREVEAFYALVDQAPSADHYALDMSRVTFVKPYGVLALVSAARHLSDACGRPVMVANLNPQVHLYLDRMNLFDVASDWLTPDRSLDDEWARNPQTPNLLELTTIRGPADVAAVISRAEQVFSRWIALPNLNDLLQVLSELCANVYQHSGDPHGCALIQKYEAPSRGQVLVCLAVGDLGCGIRASLARRHGLFGQEPLDYLHEAMRGRSARTSGRGGLGLRLTEQIAASTGGHLWLRSETAAILTSRPGRAQGRRGLVHIDGTQAAVELHAPLSA